MAKKWIIEIRHPGLNKYRCIQGYDKNLIEQKAAIQEAAWNEMWVRKLESEEKALEKEQKALMKEENIEEAKNRTEKALEEIKAIENILRYTLEVNDAINLELLKDKSDFT